MTQRDRERGGERPVRPGDRREADRAVAVAMVVLIVLLLVVGNAQLWRLADQGGATGAVPATTGTAGSSLPPPTTGTSNAILEKQMRRLTANMAAPLNGLNGQLTGLQDVGGAQREVARQIAAMGASIRGFGGVRGEIGQMSNGLGAMVSNTGAMTKGLQTTGRDMRATSASMAGLLQVMKRVEGGITATQSSSREASEGIGGMRDATSAMATSIAATAANGKEMTAAMASLNENMKALLQLFCVAFNSNAPQCASEEAPAPAPAPEAPAPGGS
jgi:hypothetical protein